MLGIEELSVERLQKFAIAQPERINEWKDWGRDEFYRNIVEELADAVNYLKFFHFQYGKDVQPLLEKIDGVYEELFELIFGE